MPGPPPAAQALSLQMAHHIEGLHSVVARIDDATLALAERDSSLVPDTVSAAVATRQAAKALVPAQVTKEKAFAPASESASESSPQSDDSWGDHAAHGEQPSPPTRTVPLPWNCVTDPKRSWSKVILMEVEQQVDLLARRE